VDSLHHGAADHDHHCLVEDVEGHEGDRRVGHEAGADGLRGDSWLAVHCACPIVPPCCKWGACRHYDPNVRQQVAAACLAWLLDTLVTPGQARQTADERFAGQRGPFEKP
jgi:hypothetical protein